MGCYDGELASQKALLTAQEFLMFALPRIPSLPAVVNPGTLIAPVKTFFNQPTTIDYDALSAAQSSITAAKAAGIAAPSAAFSGVCARVPAQTCPVCYLRRTMAPVALSGTDIELPPLEDEDPEADPEDRIFLPASTDCWGGCKYCYYCIADELAQFAQNHATDDAKWQCLRCGGNVTKAKRTGAEPGALHRKEDEGISESDSGEEAGRSSSSSDDDIKDEKTGSDGKSPAAMVESVASEDSWWAV